MRKNFWQYLDEKDGPEAMEIFSRSFGISCLIGFFLFPFYFLMEGFYKPLPSLGHLILITLILGLAFGFFAFLLYGRIRSAVIGGVIGMSVGVMAGIVILTLLVFIAVMGAGSGG